ncbi:MAG: acetyl-CoA carboxylase biotin carboxyl carrier protein [candidate division Zixibacteria bacterium]|nr:acetyl-CoA carboxylase biotin carboxyl carrier protein [candidate division Zixibacteria bacterium]
MREKTIQKLVKLVEEAEIESLTVRNWWSKVQITKRLPGGGNGKDKGSTSITLPRAEVAPTLPPVEAPAAQAPAPVVAVEEKKPADIGKEITSPMVGTFYTSSEPDAPPFADVGQTVKKGETLCIIEAMKLMNEIEAEYSCRVVERVVENAEPVEFGQTLFIVEPL